MTHEISLKHNQKMQFDVNVGDHVVKLDTSPENGGDNSAPSPKKMMLTSLAGCTAVDIVLILNKKRVSFQDFGVKVEANLTDGTPSIYDNVLVTYQIKVAEADRDKVQQAVDLSSEKYCGVMEMFRSFAKVTTAIEYL